MVLGFANALIGSISIKEYRDKIIIDGIDASYLSYDIQNYFKTSRVAKLFTNLKGYRVSMYSFFLIDFEYIVRTLSKQPKTRLGKRKYLKLLEELKQNTWLGRLDKNLPSIFNKEKIKEIKYSLLKHQEEFIEYYDKIIPRYQLKGLLLAADAGTGKTLTSIAVACAYESENVIVISPKNAVNRVWEKTLSEDMAVPQTHWVQANGTPMPNPNENRWFIFHYESLEKAVELATRIKDRKCTIILDESHNLNDFKSLRTERFIAMCSMMSNSIVVELSGTPMKALGYEAIPLIRAIDPKFTDACLDSFRKIFGKNASVATEILSNRLGIIMYKVDRKETDVKPLEEHWVNVKVANSKRFLLSTIKEDMIAFIKSRIEYYNANKEKYTAQYYECLKYFEQQAMSKGYDDDYSTYLDYVNRLAKKKYTFETFPIYTQYCTKYEKNVIEPVLRPEQRRGFRDAKSVVKYVDLKIRGEALGTVLSKARMECNRAIVDALDFSSIIDNTEKKTLIFTSYVEVVKATEQRLTSIGYKPLTVFGETNVNLNQIIKSFGSDEDINPLIATYQSLSTAVPLTMANGVILINQPFRIHEKEQAMARANRLGQDKQVHVYNILLDTGDEPNISTRSLDILKWSEEQVNAIMGFENNINVGIESVVLDIAGDIEDEALGTPASALELVDDETPYDYVEPPVTALESLRASLSRLVDK